MKKTINIVITILTLSLCLFGCNKNNSKENTVITTEVQIEQAQLTNTTTLYTQIPISELKTVDQADVGDGDILQDKYRVCYYSIPYQFSLLVDSEELKKWEDKVYIVQPNETNEMVIKRFVQDFNISREDFDKANNKDALIISTDMDEVPIMNPKDFLEQEVYEVYNADIIYTFDDEIINEYYLSHTYPFGLEDDYVNAVLAGEYKTQTTDFYFPELDSHSSIDLRGFEYSEETTVASVETTAITTEVLTEQATEEETTIAASEVITE